MGAELLSLTPTSPTHFALMEEGRITSQGNRIDDIGWAMASRWRSP